MTGAAIGRHVRPPAEQRSARRPPPHPA
jgi:hypothetical protein